MHDSNNPDGTPRKWYQGLEKYCWIVLIISALGWLFDTMDQNLFTMVRNASLRDLYAKQYDPQVKLTAPQREAIVVEETAKFLKLRNAAAVPALSTADQKQLEEIIKRAHYRAAGLDVEVSKKSGLITAIFIIGWATGGFVFGIVGDKIGRTKTMILTILIYAIFTGLSGFSQGFWFYSFTRFMTGMGVGGEWAAGAALVAETFPKRSRPMALGMLQALSTVGNMMAAVITILLGDLELGGWRTAYFIGAVPALLVLWIRRSVREPEAWVAAKKDSVASKELGSIGKLFSHPVLRRNTIAASLMATAGVGALWGIAFFSPDVVRNELGKAGMTQIEISKFAGWTFLVQQVGAFFGIYLFAMFAERFNRKRAFFLWFILAWVSTLAFFWTLQGSGERAKTLALVLAPIMGFCTLGPFAGYSIYFPELFPTGLRTTGCGFCYNVARYLAAFAPFLLGSLAAKMGGTAQAATVVSSVFILGFVGLLIGPETKGRPLPEDGDFDDARPGGFPIRATVTTTQPD